MLQLAMHSHVQGGARIPAGFPATSLAYGMGIVFTSSPSSLAYLLLNGVPTLIRRYWEVKRHLTDLHSLRTSGFEHAFNAFASATRRPAPDGTLRICSIGGGPGCCLLAVQGFLWSKLPAGRKLEGTVVDR